MRLSFFDSHKDPRPSEEHPDWGGLKNLLVSTDGRTEKYGPAWSPAYYPIGATRGKANVEGVSCLVLDLDHLTRDEVVQVETNLAHLSYMAHPSYSSDALTEDYCLRFVVELSRPVLAKEWPAFWKQAIRDLQVPADPATSDASRIYFLPARPEDEEYRLDVNDGLPLDVDAILEVAPVDPEPSATITELAHGDIPEGQREPTLHRLAANMRRFGWEHDEILAAVRLRNLKSCKPPLSDEEVVQTVASAQRYLVEDDQQGLQEFVSLLDSRNTTGPARSDNYIIDLMEFYKRHDADSDDTDKWLIEGVLGKGVPQIVAGPPKAHKSWLMYDMSLAVSSGKPWLGKFPVSRESVMVLSQEDDEREAHRRLFRLAKARGDKAEDLRGWLSVNALDRFSFGSQAYVDALRRGIEDFEPGLIFIDSLSRVHGGDENSVQDMARVTDIWATLCKEYSISVVILHHFNKGVSGGMLNRMRGSSDLGAMVRHAIGVTKLEIDDPAYQGGVSSVEFDGNLPGMADPFSVGIRDGEVDGHRAVFLEYRSNAKEEALGQVKREMINYLLASEPDPQTKPQIFSSSKAPVATRAAAFRELTDSGQIVAHDNKFRLGEKDA